MLKEIGYSSSRLDEHSTRRYIIETYRQSRILCSNNDCKDAVRNLDNIMDNIQLPRDNEVNISLGIYAQWLMIMCIMIYTSQEEKYRLGITDEDRSYYEYIVQDLNNKFSTIVTDPYSRNVKFFSRNFNPLICEQSTQLLRRVITIWSIDDDSSRNAATQ